MVAVDSRDDAGTPGAFGERTCDEADDAVWVILGCGRDEWRLHVHIFPRALDEVFRLVLTETVELVQLFDMLPSTQDRMQCEDRVIHPSRGIESRSDSKCHVGAGESCAAPDAIPKDCQRATLYRL